MKKFLVTIAFFGVLTRGRRRRDCLIALTGAMGTWKPAGVGKLDGIGSAFGGNDEGFCDKRPIGCCGGSDCMCGSV